MSSQSATGDCHDIRSETGSVDDAFRYLTHEVGLPEGQAIGWLNAKLADDSFRLHWCRTDSAGAGQKGEFRYRVWGDQLRVEIDRGNAPGHGPVDYATGRMTDRNDGRAFVRVLKASDFSGTYDFTLSMRRVRELAEETLATGAPGSRGPQRRTDAEFNKLDPLPRRVVLTLDAMESRGTPLDGIPKLQLAERVAREAGVRSISRRTLRKAESYRRCHPLNN
jgi:hypothetical protein